MAHLYEDGSGTTYDADAAKFNSVPFSTYTPFDYASETAFASKADMSMAGQMRDCAECHVGGGAMEYLPKNAPAPVTNADGSVTYPELMGRVPLRTLNASYGPTQYTAFNYFIDIFDENDNGDIFEVFYQDYSQTGVLEMDCFSCHFEGYSWQARKEQVRKGRFDASRAVGAGLAEVPFVSNVENGSLLPEYGRRVKYDTSKLVAVADSDPATAGDQPGFKLASTVAAKIKGSPPSDNCASCHQATHNVDWKKRGEIWSAQADVHGRIGCMGCHQRAEGTLVGTSGNAKDAKLAQCDPAKGGAGPWDNLMNNLDNEGFKSCEACHITGKVGDSYVQTYGAPNPAAAHAAAGLSALLLQDGRDGVADKSHIDLISCEACHINKKLFNQIQDPVTGEWIEVITGGAFVDGTGPDHEGRLADHDSAHVERDMINEDGTTNFGLVWSNDGKLHPGNFLTSFFWRDKNDIDYDANADGRPGGMDAILQTHVAKVLDNDPQMTDPLYTYGLFSDGVVTAQEVKDHIARLNSGLFSLNGQASTLTSNIKLSFLAVPFQMSHQIGSADYAKGAGGCTDCHGVNKGFYNGVLNLAGKASIAWDSLDIVPMTMVNGATGKTHLHPNHKDKYRGRSIARLLHGNGTITNQDRSAYLYEDTFQTRDAAWHDTAITSGVVAIPDPTLKGAGTKGWLLKVEVCNTATSADCSVFTPRTSQVIANVTDVSALVSNLNNSGFTAGTFGFTVAANADGTISLTPATGYKIRLSPQTDVGYFNLAAALWKEAPVTPVMKNVSGWDLDTDGVIDGRSEMEAYLNAIGDNVATDAKIFGVGVDPKAVVASVAVGGTPQTLADGEHAYQALTDDAVVVTADETANVEGFFTYSWSTTSADAELVPSEDGKEVTASFPTQGSYQVVLKVQDEEGKVDVKVTTVTVKPAPVSANATVTTGTAPGDITVEFAGLPYDDVNLVYGYDSLFVDWGDGSTSTYYYDMNRDGVRDNLTGAGTETFTHNYGAAGNYKVKIVISIYDTATKKYVPIETDPSRESDITVL